MRAVFRRLCLAVEFVIVLVGCTDRLEIVEELFRTIVGHEVVIEEGTTE